MKPRLRAPKSTFWRVFAWCWFLTQLIGVGGYVLTIDPRLSFGTFFVGFGLSVSVAVGTFCGAFAWLMEQD